MQSIPRTAPLLALVLAGLLIARGQGHAPSSVASDVLRLRAHFDSVDGELRQVDLTALDRDRRGSRDRLIAWLREYRDRAEFPVNDRFPDRATPYFRDSRGVLCAVAYLVARSGRTDIVDRIARTRNNAFIAELASDQELIRWLDSVGLTVAEASRIQPAYGGEPGGGASTGYKIASGVLIGGALVASGFNVFSPSRTSAWLGIGVGVAAGIAGVTKIGTTDSESATLAGVNLFAGAVAVALGVRGVVVGGRTKPSAEAARDPGRERGLLVNVTPAMLSLARDPQVGVVLRARF